MEARWRQTPDDALTNFLLSQIRFAFGDHSAPLALAERAVVLDGNVGKYHRQLAEVLGVQAEHAGRLQQVFLARRFRKEIDAAIRLDPKDMQALGDLLEFYLLAPGIVGGDLRKAEEAAQQIGAIDSPEGLLAQVRIALFLKRTGETDAILAKATEAQPTSYRALIELARVRLDKEPPDRKGAETVARRALDLDRSRIEAYNILAGIYADLSDWTSLDSVLKEASEKDPEDLAPEYYAAEHLLGGGREPARAERYLRTYLSQEPEGNEPGAADAHWKLGLALEAQGRTTSAVTEWKQALQLDSTSPAGRELKRVHAVRPKGY